MFCYKCGTDTMKTHPICIFLEKCEKCGYLHDTRPTSNTIIGKLNTIYTANNTRIHPLIRSKL